MDNFIFLPSNVIIFCDWLFFFLPFASQRYLVITISHHYSKMFAYFWSPGKGRATKYRLHFKNLLSPDAFHQVFEHCIIFLIGSQFQPRVLHWETLWSRSGRQVGQ